ncbi:LOG family protein [Candidatus Woesearchaeota archaeon]|nr:LOG family protein [Candidatus Woesearchaeota archaeon]
MKPKIGVMGSANEKGNAGRIPAKSLKLAYDLGQEIARHNCILVNGACNGIPNAAARGAMNNDGFVIGISPAKNLEEHAKRYRFPTKYYSVIIYTGFGFKGRNVVNVSNCDAVIIVGGRVGTLNEFTIAYDEGQVIGIMEGSGGVADNLKKIIKIVDKNTGAMVIFDKEPHTLVKRVLREIEKRAKSSKIE